MRGFSGTVSDGFAVVSGGFIGSVSATFAVFGTSDLTASGSAVFSGAFVGLAGTLGLAIAGRSCDSFPKSPPLFSSEEKASSIEEPARAGADGSAGVFGEILVGAGATDGPGSVAMDSDMIKVVLTFDLLLRMARKFLRLSDRKP